MRTRSATSSALQNLGSARGGSTSSNVSTRSNGTVMIRENSCNWLREGRSNPIPSHQSCEVQTRVDVFEEDSRTDSDAVAYINKLYHIENEVMDASLTYDELKDKHWNESCPVILQFA